jgi:hypothetical protein
MHPTSQTDAHASQPSMEYAAGNLLRSQLAVSPQKLARLDLGLLRSLHKLGTSRERICAVLCLSAEEYDYVSRLS